MASSSNGTAPAGHPGAAWLGGRWLYVITKQGDPGENTVRPNKTRYKVLAHLLDALLSYCWWVLHSSSRPVNEQPHPGSLTPRWRAVQPRRSAASAVDPFSSSRCTQSTWPFMMASISGVLQRGQEKGEGPAVMGKPALHPWPTLTVHRHP